MGGLPTGLLLLDGAPNLASTAAIVEPRCGVSTPAGLSASWPSTARVSPKEGTARASPRATRDIFIVRASMAISRSTRPATSTLAEIYPPVWQSQPLSPAADYV